MGKQSPGLNPSAIFNNISKNVQNLFLICIIFYMLFQHLSLTLFLLWLEDRKSVFFFVLHDLFDNIHPVFQN